mgnify:CR=1 FL=1
MIEIYHRICLAMEDKEIMCMIFCDISKAFDRLWHKGLLEKIKTYGIKGNLLGWIENYLSNRRQKVLLKNSESAFGTLKAGVPQGSVLGPLLFLMFINDIADEIQCLVRLFADDSSLMYSSNNALDIERRLNEDLQTLNDWSKQWLVDFNPQKTEYMVFNFRKDAQPIYLKFNGELIKKVDDHKHLGVTFSDNCKWSVHIDNICCSATKQIFVLRKLKYILNRNNLNKIYLAYILPLLEYACELWDGCCVRDSEKIERLQFEAARIITGLPQFASIESLLFETGWETLSSRRNRRKLCLFHKIHSNNVPEYLMDCISNYTDDNYYNTRNRSHYRVPRCRLDIFSKSFFPSSIRTWNLLPLDIRSIQSSPNFKNTIRRNDISFLVPKYYFIGNRMENILHTKLRHRCSPLKADLYRVNLVNDPSCECGCPLEDSIHFFLECPLYINFRNQLFKNIQHLADISIEHILFGTDEITVEQNTILFRNVHSYIRHTKRFFD